jgi:hypothetical protein
MYKSLADSANCPRQRLHRDLLAGLNIDAVPAHAFVMLGIEHVTVRHTRNQVLCKKTPVCINRLRESANGQNFTLLWKLDL